MQEERKERRQDKHREFNHKLTNQQGGWQQFVRRRERAAQANRQTEQKTVSVNKVQRNN